MFRSRKNLTANYSRKFKMYCFLEKFDFNHDYLITTIWHNITLKFSIKETFDIHRFWSSRFFRKFSATAFWTIASWITQPKVNNMYVDKYFSPIHFLCTRSFRVEFTSGNACSGSNSWICNTRSNDKFPRSSLLQAVETYSYVWTLLLLRILE